MIPLEEDVNFLLEYPPGRLMLFATKCSNISVCHWHHAMKGWHTKKIDILLILEHTIAQDNSLYLFIHHVWLEEGGSFKDFLFNAKAWLFHNIRTFERLLNWICNIYPIQSGESELWTSNAYEKMCRKSSSSLIVIVLCCWGVGEVNVRGEPVCHSLTVQTLHRWEVKCRMLVLVKGRNL